MRQIKRPEPFPDSIEVENGSRILHCFNGYLAIGLIGNGYLVAALHIKVPLLPCSRGSDEMMLGWLLALPDSKRARSSRESSGIREAILILKSAHNSKVSFTP